MEINEKQTAKKIESQEHKKNVIYNMAKTSSVSLFYCCTFFRDCQCCSLSLLCKLNRQPTNQKKGTWGKWPEKLSYRYVVNLSRSNWDLLLILVQQCQRPMVLMLMCPYVISCTNDVNQLSQLDVPLCCRCCTSWPMLSCTFPNTMALDRVRLHSISTASKWNLYNHHSCNYHDLCRHCLMPI